MISLGSFEQGNRRLKRSYTTKDVQSSDLDHNGKKLPVIFDQSNVKKLLNKDVPDMPGTTLRRNNARLETPSVSHSDSNSAMATNNIRLAILTTKGE